MNPREFNSYSSFYIQPFKWEEDVERSFDNKSQVTHCWAMAIPANENGDPVVKETTTTCLFRIKNYPYRVTLIVSTEGVTESEIRNIRSYFQDWATTYHGMRCIDRDGYNSMKGRKWEEIENYFTDMYAAEYSPRNISYEKRRRVYYYKRSSDTPNDINSGLKYPERESWVINLDFVNKAVAQKFSGLTAGNYMSSEFINGKKCKALTKQIMGKTYTFEVGFKGIDSVQKLLTERKVPRCGWFFVRDVEIVKAAQRICPQGYSRSWVTEGGSPMVIDNYTPEFFVESVSILEAKPSVARSLLSVPATVSWDIECYSDNHKALPVAWNPKHSAYIITAVYQQYRRPETRIRKAFVFGKCDYNAPTESDGKTSALVKCDTEMEMIDQFSQFVQDVNAEILIGYNIFGFDINYLTIRMQRSLRKWNNMGRLKENITQTSFIDWNSSAYGKNQLYWIEAPGRICVDMMKIIERDYKYSDYKLETVSQALLGKGKNDVSPQEMFRIYEMCLNNQPGCETEMLKVVMYGIQDAVLPIELFEKINGWPFLIESSNVMCVNPMELFTRGQQLRLLNQFYDKCFHMGFVIDSRSVNVIEAEGAYVVDPIKGLHENVMTLDFASLYPSIMIAHNIGQDTYVLPDDPIPDEHCHVFEWTDEEEKKLNDQGGFEEDAEATDNMLSKWVVEDNNDEEGRGKYKIQKTTDGKWRFRFIKEEYGHRSIVATMLVDLLGARKAVRNEQKKVKDSDPVYYDILEQRQKAIKVSCNSAYGMLLAQESGKLALAEGGVCVTFRGRQLNLEMQRLARERYGATTIYGDSVTGDTPVLVRDPINGMRYENIEDLGSDWEEGYHGYKQLAKFSEGLEVWSDKGFTKVERLIRHKCDKRIFRVLTTSGCVDVTEDHSLLNEKSEKISPKDIRVGQNLLHNDLPPADDPMKYIPMFYTCKLTAARDYHIATTRRSANIILSCTDRDFRLTCSSYSELNFNKIVDIIDLGLTNDYVYDFTTANHHFSAGIGRLVVHNTDSIMVKTAYTKLMVEAAKKFDTDKPSIEEIDRLATELNIKDYSHDIAGRFLDHYHGFKEEHEVCNEMGEHIARDISSHLPKPISLEFENVFVKALFMMKKRYACIVLDRDKMIIKAHPNKMYTKGIMLARRDNCHWARELFRDALFNILMGKSRQEVALIVNEHVQKLLTWQVPMEELQIIQKLGFDYKSDTFPLKLFSEHLQDIGKPAKPNDRIPFIVSSRASRLANPEDPKLGHYYRLIETLREEISRGENSIDYLYYIDRLTNDVNQIFSIGYIPDIQLSRSIRESKRFTEIDLAITKVDNTVSKLETRCETMEDSLRTLPDKSKEAVQLRKELRVERKKLNDVNKERDKVLKQRALLENKGLEKFDKKRNNNDLMLDDTFYTHVVDMLTVRKHLMKQIIDKSWVLNPHVSKPEVKKSPQKSIRDFFKSSK